MSDDATGMEEAERRIAEEAERRTGKLDLFNLGLQSLPEGLFRLEHLRVLDLGATQGWETYHRPNAVHAQRHRLAELVGLEDLRLEWSDLHNLDFTTKLNNLVILDCKDTRVSNLEPISNLSRLEVLDLYNTQVIDLSPIFNIITLKILDFSRTQIDDLTPLEQMVLLSSLWCAQSQVLDLTPLAGLTALKSLNCSGTQVVDLAPLSGLATLDRLSCSHTKVADLAPILSLSELTYLDCRAARLTTLSTQISNLRNLRRLDLRDNRLVALPGSLGSLTGLGDDPGNPEFGRGGLHLEGNPLAPPLPALIAPGQPQATRNVLAWLRGELDPVTLAPRPSPAEPPPAIPDPGPGLHITLGDSGAITFAAPEELDAEGNHLRRLRSLHPELQTALDALRKALAAGNAPPSVLAEAVTEYAAIADRALEEMDFALLVARGVRLRHAAVATRDAIARDKELPLSLASHASLDTLLDLHGMFIGATKDGIELRADEEAENSTPAERRAQRKAAVALAEAVQGQPEIVSDPVAKELLAAARASGEGPNPARSSVIASAQVRHVATAVIGMGTAAVLAGALMPTIGPGGSVLVGLLAVKPIESTKGYGIVKDYLARQLNRPGDGDPAAAVAALNRHHGFLLRHARRFRALAKLGEVWAWIGTALDWITSRPFELPRPIPPRPQPPRPPRPAPTS